MGLLHLGCNKEVAALLRYVASSSGFTGRGLEGEAATIGLVNLIN